MGKRFEIQGKFYRHADIVAIFYLWDDDVRPAMWIIVDDGKLVLEDEEMYEVVESFEAGVARAEYLLSEWRQSWLDDMIEYISVEMEGEEREREYEIWEDRQAFANEEKERVARGEVLKTPGLWTFGLSFIGE